jgi:hypothetical protein
VQLDLNIRLQTGSFDYVNAEGQYEVDYYTHTVGTELTSIADKRAAGYGLCLYYSLASTDPTGERRNSVSKQATNDPFIFHYIRLSVTFVHDIASVPILYPRTATDHMLLS